MSSNTNQKKWLWPVVFGALAAVVLLAVALNYAVRAERNVRYVGMMDVVAEKLSKTFRGVEMNAENVFDEVAKHMESPQAVVEALGSKTSLNPDVIGYFAAFIPNYFPQEGRWFQPYVHQGDSTEFMLTFVGSARHDYTTSTWYVQGIKEKESFWSEPYYYEDDLNVASGYYMTFATPIFDAQGRLACVCGADMTQEWMIEQLRQIEDEVRNDELLNNYRLSGNDDFFIVILNDDGTSFAHPDGDIVTMVGGYCRREMKKNVFIAQARMSILRRLYVVALTAVMATLAAMAQTSDAGGNDRIAQLEKEMYRYYSSNAIDSFMLITDQLIEACREAGPSQERLFYKAWSNQAIYSFNRVNRTRGLELAHQIHDYAYQHDSKFGLYTSTYALATMSSSLRHFVQAEHEFTEAINYQHRRERRRPLPRVGENLCQYGEAREGA